MDEMNITYFSSSLSQTFFWHGDGKCCFYTVFYSVLCFLWNGLINRTSIFIAEELDVCPCWNRKILHLPWMTKDVRNMLTIWSAVSFNWSFCSEVEHVIMHWRTMDEMKNAPFSSSCPQRLFEAVGRSESTIGFLTVITPPTTPSVNNNGTCNVATSSNQATSSRIQHHPTHFTWRYYTPPPPPPPISI